MLDVSPIQQVFTAGRVIPRVLDDPHVIDPLPAALRLRVGGDEEQQTSRKQPQSPCHVSQDRSVRTQVGRERCAGFGFESNKWGASAAWKMQAARQAGSLLGGRGSTYETLRGQYSRSIEPEERVTVRPPPVVSDAHG